MLMPNIAVFFVIVFLFNSHHVMSNESSHSNNSCESAPKGMCLCYNELESSLFATEDNKMNLTTTFFPLEDNQPEFVIVKYCFNNVNTTSCEHPQIWFWSAYTSHFLHPFEVFQFSSLFFGKPEPYNRRRMTIILSEKCARLSQKDIKLQLLTQRVSFFNKKIIIIIFILYM